MFQPSSVSVGTEIVERGCDKPANCTGPKPEEPGEPGCVGTDGLVEEPLDFDEPEEPPEFAVPLDLLPAPPDELGAGEAAEPPT